MSDRTELKKAFLERKWRVTLGVRMTYDLLGGATTFFSAHEIAKKLERRFDVTTVYRVLEKLQKVKLVHEFHGKWKLCTDLHNHSEAHHFLICEKCGTADEIFLDYQETISEQLAKEKNFILKKVHLGFLGICSRCH